MKDVLMHVRRSLIVVEEGFRSLVKQILSPFLLWLWVIPKNYQVPKTGRSLIYTSIQKMNGD